MSDGHIDISQINTAFDENTEPLDNLLLALLKAAYKGDMLCRMALVDIDVIEPFSDFQPVIAPAYRAYFMQKAKANAPPKLYVYQKKDKLIMSDDYAAYQLYKELNIHTVPCVIIGSCTIHEGVDLMGKPYILQPPSVDVIA
ncbi:MAG TPA: hypothetical protein VLE74_03325 [Candidatus Saccharimonadales bacterium]|nr:hypothetical protein [Candidatus Saccharimonadales bacterium]